MSRPGSFPERERTTRHGCLASRARRTVNRGLSWRNVSAPITIASTCARSSRACRRVAGPVIQRSSSGGLVRRPSRLIPHFAIHERLARYNPLVERFVQSAAFCGQNAFGHFDSRRSSMRECHVRCAGDSGLSPRTTRRTPALTIASVQGGVRAGRRTGFERHIECRQTRAELGAFARQPISACGSPLARW